MGFPVRFICGRDVVIIGAPPCVRDEEDAMYMAATPLTFAAETAARSVISDARASDYASQSRISLTKNQMRTTGPEPRVRRMTRTKSMQKDNVRSLAMSKVSSTFPILNATRRTGTARARTTRSWVRCDDHRVEHV